MCSQYVSAICRSLCGGLFVLIRLCAGCHPVTRVHPLCRPCTGLGRHTGHGPSRRRRTDTQAGGGRGGAQHCHGGGKGRWPHGRKGKCAPASAGGSLNKAPPKPDKHHYRTEDGGSPHIPLTLRQLQTMQRTVCWTTGLWTLTRPGSQTPLSNTNQSINRENCLGEISPKY